MERKVRPGTLILNSAARALCDERPDDPLTRKRSLNSAAGGTTLRRPPFGIRFDVFTNQFRAQVLVPSHLNNPFGSNLTTEYESAGVTGLSADAIGNVDSRGIVYTFGGVGVYSKYQGSPAGFSTGASLSAGIAIPVREHFRVFAEARKHFLFGAGPTPPWIVPITVGVRY